MISIYIFYPLVPQPDGNKTQNCLTTFKPKNGTLPMWYDRPCNETEDGETAPGHKFMCESNAIPDPITTTDTTPVTITTSASTSKYKYIS